MSKLWKILTHKKLLDDDDDDDDKQRSIVSNQNELKLFDLLAVGFGGGLSIGCYILLGYVTRDVTGPATVLSVILAGLSALFAGLCYIEFGTRTPHVSLAYTYAHVCLGEFVAFVIGWTLLAEYIIGMAIISRSFTLYIDVAVFGVIGNKFEDVAPLNHEYLGNYYDFIALILPILMALELILQSRRKKNHFINSLLNYINLIVIIAFIIIGATKVRNFDYWKINDPLTNGNFVPYGWRSVFDGAAIYLFSFIGLDCIGKTNEPINNRSRTLPFSVIGSVLFSILIYTAITAIFTLMVPYSLQDFLYINTPLSYAFELVDWNIMKYAVAYLGIFQFSTSVSHLSLTIPKLLAAMNSDGLIMNWLGKKNERFPVPIVGTFLIHVIAGILGSLINSKYLMKMMSIGLIFAFIAMSICVLLMRYTTSYNLNTNITLKLDHTPNLFNCWKKKYPTNTTERIVAVSIVLYCLISILLSASLKYYNQDDPIVMAISLALLICLIILLIAICAQPIANNTKTFKVPIVPLIPGISITLNIFLLLSISTEAWVKFAIWLLLGLPIYFYSTYKKNTINFPMKEQVYNNDNHEMSFYNYGFETNEEGIINAYDNNQPTKLINNDQEPYETVNCVLADLDRTLDKAYSTTLDNDEQQCNLRKLSYETVSNSSNRQYEENVVAIVHYENGKQTTSDINENVVTAAVNVDYTIPIPPPLPILLLHEIVNDDEKNVFVPPPAPPMPKNFEKTEMTNSIVDRRRIVKQKPMKETIDIPEPDYDMDEAVSLKDEGLKDNVKFGTVNMLKFRNKLDGLMTPAVRHTMPNIKQLTSEKRETSEIVDSPTKSEEVFVNRNDEIVRNVRNDDNADDDDVNDDFVTKQKKLEVLLQKSVALRNDIGRRAVKQVFNDRKQLDKQKEVVDFRNVQLRKVEK